MLYRKIQIGKSALGLHLKDGRLEADLTQLTLYQGSGKGKVVVDGSAAVPAIQAEFNLASVQVEPLLKDAMDNDRLTGTGAIDLAVTGHGKSQREIMTALNGKGGLNLANGKIKGMNLVGMVNSAASALSNPGAALAALKGGGGGSQETDFVSLTATYTIANGILHNSDLQMKSAELPVSGAGTADLPHRTVDYKTRRMSPAPPCPSTSRAMGHLSYEPDLAGMVGDPSKLLKGGAKGVEDTIKKNPTDTLKGLLGRWRDPGCRCSPRHECRAIDRRSLPPLAGGGHRCGAAAMCREIVAASPLEGRAPSSCWVSWHGLKASRASRSPLSSALERRSNAPAGMLDDLADFCAGLGRLAEAEDDGAQRALAAPGVSAVAWHHLALVLIAGGKLAEARTALTRRSRVSPDRSRRATISASSCSALRRSPGRGRRL